MSISRVIPQLRTTDLSGSIRFYTETLGFTLAFRYEDFYAGIRAGECVVHLKYVCEPDPSIEYVDKAEHFRLYLQTDDVASLAGALKNKGVPLVREVHHTDWGTKEFVMKDDQGHTLYFGESD